MSASRYHVPASRVSMVSVPIFLIDNGNTTPRSYMLNDGREHLEKELSAHKKLWEQLYCQKTMIGWTGALLMADYEAMSKYQKL